MNKDKLQKIYDELPDIDCKGHCHTSCGPIAYGPSEERNIEDEHGQKGLPSPEFELTCNQLDSDKRCSIYNERPLLCRLYGLTKKLRCDYGCKPDEWLSERKARKLMDRVIREQPTSSFQKYLNK